jgi:hypothetical protein
MNSVLWASPEKARRRGPSEMPAEHVQRQRLESRQVPATNVSVALGTVVAIAIAGREI